MRIDITGTEIAYLHISRDAIIVKNNITRNRTIKYDLQIV